jgi:peptide/nickel transport system substrate-binding protein
MSQQNEAQRPRPARRSPMALCAIGVLVAAAIGVSGCGGSSDANSTSSASNPSIYTHGIPGSSPQRGGHLTYAISPSNFQTSLDPATGNEGIVTQIFNQLLELRPGSDTPQPALATSWKISNGGKTYDLELRHDVKFSNGEPLRASDVAYTLHRLTTPANTTGQFIFPNTFHSISVVGPYEVRFVLNRPTAAMLDYLAEPTLSIVPQHVVEKEGESFGIHPVGSGPFVVKSFSQGKTLQLERNPLYWRSQRPYLDSLTYTVTEEANQRILSVRSGQAQVADVIPYSQVASLEHTGGVTMLHEETAAVDNLYWNTSKARFNETAVRRALAYDTPSETIVKTVYHNLAEPANSIIPSNGYRSKSVPYFKYDLAKAKKLLAGSNAAKGFGVTMWVVSGDPDASLIATILQNSWGQLGVKVAIKQADANTVFEHMFGGEYQVAVVPSGFFYNPVAVPDDSGQLVYDYYSGSHGLASYFNSSKEIELIHQASASYDQATRRKDFEALQRLAEESVQLLPLAFPPRTFLVGSAVRNFMPLYGGGITHMEEVYLAH